MLSLDCGWKNIDEGLAAGMALVGTFLGMIGFGVYGDLVGRKKAFLPTLVLILISSLGSAVAARTASGEGERKHSQTTPKTFNIQNIHRHLCMNEAHVGLSTTTVKDEQHMAV
jgi:hypothetical protein